MVGGTFIDSFDASVLWIGLRRWGDAGTLALAAVTGALLAVGVGSKLPAWVRVVAVVSLLVALVASLFDGLTFFQLWRAGTIDPWMPVPLSLLISTSLAWIVAYACRDGVSCRRRPLAIGGAVITSALVFPFAQMACFGKTDYRRPADAAVVFGARAYDDGRPSDALADRVRTACGLYADGFVETLVFSGGPGDGAIHETEAMRRMALAAGVPDRAIVLDPAGVNTDATVRNTVPLLRRAGKHRVLAVSHGYHLPRVKLAYQRAGMEVYTVPARETYTLTKMPILMSREVLALWVYYARPLVG